jgi:lipopolysaccharide/colanic/teichoic acid biosynthesis glycosyltransferase
MISYPTLTQQDFLARYGWLNEIDPADALFKGRSYSTAKRLMDLAIVIATLPVVLPMMIFCAVLIKLESPNGPVFFSQIRTGQGGRKFAMYKFRTMVPNAEDLKRQLAHLNELQWPDFKITNDPRITRIGRFLRKTSLDELPQLFNVLKGEMSLVGPRPTSFSATTYSLWHTERLDVKPGLTGLWQITGRGTIEFDERLRFDIANIERRCLWLDIQILFRTVTAVLEQRGAH